MRLGRAILRGIKLAAFACAGLLVCMVAYDVMTMAPMARESSAVPEADNVAGPAGRQAAPAVPPPPPLPGQSKATAPGHRPASSKRLPDTRDAVRIREVDPSEQSSASSPQPGSVAESGPAEPTGLGKDSDQPAAVIILRPPVRPVQENRAMRWIKAVGHALHISGQKDE